MSAIYTAPKKSSERNTQRKKNIPTKGYSLPYTWLLLAISPLFIAWNVFEPDGEIKPIWIALVLGSSFLFTKANSAREWKFSLHEIFWIGYMLLGAIALSWSLTPVLGFDRLMYLLLGVAAYIVAKETKFWRSELFWQVFTSVALLVSFIGVCTYFFAGTPLGFDWIPSAGKPSSTLSYRPYAATYLVLNLPFLLWLTFSNYSTSKKFFLLYGLAFGLSAVFLIQTRARSEWIGAAMAFIFMALLYFKQRKNFQLRHKKFVIGLLCMSGILSAIPASKEMLESDKSQQKLAWTDKVDITKTFTSIFQSVTTGNLDRLEYWRVAKKMMFEQSKRGIFEGPAREYQWLLGIGIAQFPPNSSLYMEGRYVSQIELHNDWLQAFLELGPLGFLFIAGFLLMLLYYSAKISNRGIGIACAGMIVAWIFSTQTDFFLPRIYAMVWVAGVAAIIAVEADVKSIFSIKNFFLHQIFRKILALLLLWIGFTYYISYKVDRKLYDALVKQTQPLNIAVKDIFRTANFTENFWNANNKPAVDRQLRELNIILNRSQMTPENKKVVLETNVIVAKEIIALHPYANDALITLIDGNTELGNYSEALHFNSRITDLYPRKFENWVIKGKIQLEQHDSAKAVESFRKAINLSGKDTSAYNFMRMKLNSRYRDLLFSHTE